jgi:hypothetical protein
MASTYSDLKIELIGTGEQTGTWGTTTNNNFSIALSEAITGSADVAFSSADVTVTLTDTNAAQTARNLRLNLTGTSGGARNLILGSGCQIEKLYLINNGLADAVTVKNTSGTGIVVPAGSSMFVYNNGTNVVEALKAITVGAGGTGNGVQTVGTNGGVSSIFGVAPSGGGGGGYYAGAPNTGGSGGGAGGGTSPTGANGISGQGSKGGNGDDFISGDGLGYSSGGGGGGASGGGGNAVNDAPGNGGAGRSTTIRGTTEYFAGGGAGWGWNGGGTGGIGGGGGATVAGTPNTGGGGGGSNTGRDGGSGIVIVSYRIA